MEEPYALEKQRLLSLHWQVWLLFLLSAVDACATDTGLRLQLITEGNPLMAALYDSGRIPFYSVKLSGPLLLVMCCGLFKDSSIVRWSLSAALLLYVLIAFLHMYWIVVSLALA